MRLIFHLLLAAVPATAALFAAAPPLPPFKMTAATSAGIRRFDSGALFGKVWIADFILTECSGPCPMLTANMAGLQKRLPAGVMLVSFTVDPKHDNAAALRRYARRYGADPKRWVFLTAPEGQIKRLLADEFKIAFVRDPSAPDGIQISHSSKFVLVGKDGRISRYYSGDEPESLEALVRDAASLEAAR